MLAPLAFLAAIASAQVPDCTHPNSELSRAACAAADAAMAAADAASLDDELSRLYRRATAGAPPARRATLVRQRREGAAARRACAEREELPYACQSDLYLGEIAELRRTSAIAPTPPDLSSRPIRYRCNGGDPDLWLTFFETSPVQAWIAIPARNEGHALVRPDGSHVYRSRDDGQSYDLLTRIVLVNARVCRPAVGIGQWPVDWAG